MPTTSHFRPASTRRSRNNRTFRECTATRRTRILFERGRLATAVVFIADGGAFGLWVSHLAVVRAHFDLAPALLAAVLFAVSGGAIAGTFAGTMMLARGDTRVLQAGVIASSLLAVAALAAPSLATLFAGAIAFAVALGAAEVAMNAVAARVQIAAGRTWMSSFHGCWSIGFFGGASLTAILLARHGPDIALPGAVVVGVACTGAWLARRIPRQTTASARQQRAPVDRRTRQAIAQLAAIVFFGWLGEGALTDWAPIFVSVVLGQTAAVAAGVSTAYGLAMTCARFAGDAFARRYGARAILVVSTAAASLLIAVATLRPAFALTALAFALAGAAIANLSPLVFSLGGAYGGRAVGVLTSIGYVAFLSGPALLGGVAHVAGLQKAFLVPLVALSISALLAARLRTQTVGQAGA